MSFTAHHVTLLGDQAAAAQMCIQNVENHLQVKVNLVIFSCPSWLRPFSPSADSSERIHLSKRTTLKYFPRLIILRWRTVLL